MWASRPRVRPSQREFAFASAMQHKPGNYDTALLMREACDAEVEHFADFAAEIARRIGLLQDGQTLLLNRLEQGNIGAISGGENHGHFRFLRTDLRKNLQAA